MEIVNRVAESDLIVFDLAACWEHQRVAEIDLAPFLYRGLVLREKDFRAAVAALDAEAYAGQHVALFCSTDAIVPTWAWMLVATHLDASARSVTVGRAADARREHFARALDAVDWSAYEDRIVVVKGCGGKDVPPEAYVFATHRLMQVARKLLYGEPCSSVPLWRRPKAKPARPATTTAAPPPGPR